ncbi:galactose-binding domain-like protein [Lentinula raphanica]|uniref:Galactose-binding domain-like protein n=1 Tax=Lentinula raphanica TaxID=153919 RepID=A0AA38U6L0_9AGAR|nr:galactose-binding domain-like protein [Lentinula raphanica]
MPYSSSSSAADTFKGGERTNLWRYIDRDNVRGLNLSNPDSASETIKDWNLREDLERFADSSVDDQVIIHVPFLQNVRLRSVLLKLGTGETAPSRLRIYANQPNIVNFSKAETTKAHFKIKLMQDVPRVVEYPLRTAAFASINSVSLFISESLGGKVSRIYYVGFKGEVIPLEKDKDPQMDVPTVNAADAPLFDQLQGKASGLEHWSDSDDWQWADDAMLQGIRDADLS